MKFKTLPKNKISKLPEAPGVYAFLKGRKFLYIGKAVNLLNRVKQHKLDSVEFTKLDRAKYIAYIETKSEASALLLEAKLIKKYQPKYNIDWKDDKNFFYVGITKEAFPRIFITHQPKFNKNASSYICNEKRSQYIGPFIDGKKLKQALKELRKIHPYRTCKTLPKKPCLWHDLNQCQAPCLFPSKHLEAYDISNIQGTEATGSMVTFIDGKPNKKFYRKFKIHPIKYRSAVISPKAKLFNRVKTIEKPNDVAMMKQVLSRRLKHREWPYPDLILIDGGRAQLNAATLVAKPYTLKAKIVALAKKENKLYVEKQKNPVLLKNLPQEFANLILQARDEAHRFAKTYHHHLREKYLLH